MTNYVTTAQDINGGVTEITLPGIPTRLNTLVAFSGRATGVISFRTKSLFAAFQVPGAPNSIDLAVNSSISFIGEPLDAIELTDAGSGSVTVTVLQY